MGAYAHPIDHGSTVTLHFSIVLEDGTVAESSFGGEPLRFVMSEGVMAQGLELALFGLRAGDRQTLRIEARDAFGFPDPAQQRDLPRSDFPADMLLAVGQIIGFSSAEGEEVPGTVLALNDETVKVDFNHPLAGHEITFSVEILEVEPPG